MVTVSDNIAIALSNLRSGKRIEAKEIYQQILQQIPNHPDALRGLGMIAGEEENQLAEAYLKSGKIDLAIATVHRTLQLYPDYAVAYKTLGNIYLKQGQENLALDAYQKSVELDPNFAEGLANIGSVYYKKGQLDQAINYYQKAININPNIAGFYSNMAKVLEEQGRHYESLTFQEMARQIPINASLAIAEQTQKPNFNQPGEFRLKSDPVSIEVAEKYLAQGNLIAALSTIEQVIAIAPYDGIAYKVLGNIYLHQGQNSDAINAYTKAIQLKPDFAEAYGNIGNIHYRNQNWEEAKKYYQKAIEIKPDIAGFYWNLGKVLQRQEKFEEAIFNQHKALQLQPDLVSAENHYNIGSVFLHQGKLEEALQCYQRAAELNPTIPEPPYRIGVVLHRQGKFDEGIRYFHKALEIDPDYIPAYQSLCDFNLGRDKFVEARAAADRYLKQAKGDKYCMALTSFIKVYQESGLGLSAYDKFLELETKIYHDQQEWNSFERERFYGNLIFSLAHLRDDLEANTKLIKLLAQLYASQLDEQIQAYEKPPKKPLAQRDRLGKPLRIGFLSKFFRRHSVGWCSADILRELKKITPHIYLYVTGSMPTDDRTQIFENLAEKFYRATAEDGTAAAKEVIGQIQQDQLDILVDLDSVTLLTQVEIMRAQPAPVCVSWLGFDAPFMREDNYYLCDRHTHPEGVDQYYQEKLIRMPDCHVAVGGFKSNPADLDILRKTFRISKDQIIYLCVAPGQKFNYNLAKAQVAILKYVPNSVLFYKGRQGDPEVVSSLYRSACQAQGVSHHRIKFLLRTKFEEEHRISYQMADVLLDAYPYNGMTHTLEALWFNLPIVTLTGQQSASRLAYCLLKTLGVEAGITRSWEEYIKRGIRFGLDADFRNSVKEQLIQSKQPENLSPLWNPQKFAHDLYGIFEELFRQRVLRG